ncbi:DUF817 family protein [Nonomuraea sp. NPDC059007]|uniref:DUF817 family protein n=1 Tax=Nonomuraea sp. NPDC059007 TaxID=3346692 RepID=UPI0036B67750
MTFSAAQLIRFAYAEARSCRFAVAMFAGLAASSVLPLPIPRYDALLVYAVAVTVIFRTLRWESTQETGGREHRDLPGRLALPHQRGRGSRSIRPSSEPGRSTLRQAPD